MRSRDCWAYMEEQEATLVNARASCKQCERTHQSHLIQVTGHVLPLVLFCLQLGQSLCELGFQLWVEFRNAFQYTMALP